MYTRRMEKVKKMPTQGQWRGQVPQLVTGKEASTTPREVHVTHTHRHAVVPWEALDWRGFRDMAEGFLAIEKTKDLRFKRYLELAKFAAICTFALPLVLAGSSALIRYAMHF